MKDILKQELGIGDRVAFNPPRYKGLILGRVAAFTPKMVKVTWTDWNRDEQHAYVYPHEVVRT